MLMTAALALAVTACSNPVSNLADCVPEYTEGAASAQVAATGRPGEQPDVSFPVPLFAEGVQVSELAAGKGEVLYPGQVVDFQIVALSSRTGEAFTASSYEADDPIRRTIGVDVLGTLLECTRVGSRIAATTTIADIYGEQAPEGIGLGLDDTIVLVIDVERAFLGKANGSDRLAQAGLPSVVLAPNGQPGITIPREDPPTELRSAVLKQGQGTALAEGDRAVVHFSAFVWESGEAFGSSWESTVPTTFTVKSSPSFEDGVLPGLAEVLVGAQVGTQVIVLVPPEQGYSEESAPAGYEAGTTLIFVIDILGIE